MRENTNRGQAFTLEGFIGSIVLLTAVLLALQAVVITPTTGGLADRTTQAQLQQEAKDALVVSNHDGNLSETVRNWNESAEQFEGAQSAPAPNQNETTYNASQFADHSTLGEILDRRYQDDGWSYNVELVYAAEEDSNEEFNSTFIVYQGSAPSDAFVASHIVTLYEDEEILEGDNQTREAHNHDEYPIPPGTSEDNDIYNLVELRVIIW